MAKERKPKNKKNVRAGQKWQPTIALLKRTLRAGRYLAPLAALVALTWGGWYWMTHTQRFALQRILVNPCEHVDTKNLLSFIDARVGTNLFAIELEALQSRIKTHHWIRNVVVHRRLPDSLVITIEEYVPYAQINLSKFYYVDSEGDIFKLLGKNDDHDYPILSGFSTGDFRPDGAGAKKKVAQLKVAVDLIRAASDLGAVHRKQISEVRYDTLIGYTLVLQPKGTEVRLGVDRLEEKLTRLRAIRDHLGARASELKLVDLADPDQAVVTGLRKVKAG